MLMPEQEKFVPPEISETSSQVEPSEAMVDLVSEIKPPFGADSLAKIRDLVHTKIERKMVDESNAGEEKALRWKRTAARILEDGYAYKGKDCTDLTVLFIGLCRALGLETEFVKLKNEKSVHSVAEIKLGESWYAFDVSRADSIPEKIQIAENEPFHGWRLWKKGRDAWDLGLTEFDSIKKIK
jgi:hypothetical protein